jgi:hypothetical protein
MPVLRLVQAAQPKTAHCIINNGYNIKNGGLGNVIPIQIAHKMLRNQAVISNTNLKGHSLKSRLAQLYTLVPVLSIVVSITSSWSRSCSTI